MPGTALDPTPFTAWGVLGLLGLVVIALIGVIWKLFVKQTQSAEVRDKVLMDFVNAHRGETTAAMQGVAQTVANSHDKMTVAFNRQAQLLDQMLYANRVLEKVESMRSRGVEITPDQIATIVRMVADENARRGDRAT